MIDGIKIECTINDRRKWENSLYLIARHAEQTGEVLPLPAESQLNGCTFARVQTSQGKRYTLTGSLHRYFKKGAENDDGYTAKDLRATIHTLQNTHSIDPQRSKIINFEFGVNIKLPIGIEAKDFQKYLVSAYTKAFEKLNPKRPAVGYIAEFNEYSIKIYDKGYQANKGVFDLLRVEIKVNRTRWLDQFNFIKGDELYLSDLLDKGNQAILGNILIEKVSSLILTPRKVELSKLSPKQRLTFYECRDARSWEEWSSRQRERKKQQLAVIFRKLRQPNPVDVLAKLVRQQWSTLTREPEPPKESQKHRQKVTFSTLIVDGIRDLFSLLNSHEYPRGKDTTSAYVVYRPRGTPLAHEPPPALIPGVARWIDLISTHPP